uniref:M n=1 Tax=Lotus corniculatus virus 1 TaxID=2793731 RepID=A0A8D9UJ46_9RHAB|nr:TPA_asm: M [Lotus corniculatus virus 1]
MSTWIQIKFENTEWFYEKINGTQSLTADPKEKIVAMTTSFLKAKLTGDKKPVGDLLTCMLKASRVNTVNTIGKSKYLGPGCKKCTLLLPKSIVIPTDINIHVGITDIPTMHQEIKVDDIRYHMTLGLRVRAAIMSAEEADILWAAKPAEFIGYIDCCEVPPGRLGAMKETSQSPKSDSK